MKSTMSAVLPSALENADEDVFTALRKSVSIVVPTFREAASLPHLLERIERVRSQFDLDIEVIVVDDDSRDGTEDLLSARNVPWVELVVRKSERGLSTAVLQGLQRA